ncbi:MAG: hypothetical protein KBC42_03140 [Candidatus Pacebacteria bacterium]|jgi:hypothetical protein|nr:hypothetical protein [Candidatus Paceibacterota bacterium]MBP9780895.1 hypothetical protein [Candidatus Paceibacterota bacterium]MDQ5949885.1 hypothetical protein [Patescibacteria group bacterium]MDQ5961999.1 hypothetical protein [Patescibacteria group bacterium]
MTEHTQNTLIGVRQEALIHLSDSEKLLGEYGRYAENLEQMIDKLSLDLSDETMDSYNKLKIEFQNIQDKITQETAWFDQLYALMNTLNQSEDLDENLAQEIISKYQELRDKKVHSV